MGAVTETKFGTKVAYRDELNVRLWHLAEAEGLAGSNECRTFSRSPAECCILGWTSFTTTTTTSVKI